MLWGGCTCRRCLSLPTRVYQLQPQASSASWESGTQALVYRLQRGTKKREEEESGARPACEEKELSCKVWTFLFDRPLQPRSAGQTLSAPLAFPTTAPTASKPAHMSAYATRTHSNPISHSIKKRSDLDHTNVRFGVMRRAVNNRSTYRCGIGDCCRHRGLYPN